MSQARSKVKELFHRLTGSTAIGYRLDDLVNQLWTISNELSEIKSVLRTTRMLTEANSTNMNSNTYAVFYGTGSFMQANLERAISEGLVPLCFIDNDKTSQKKIINSSTGMSFEIISLHEALKRFPTADIYIMLEQNMLLNITKLLIEHGVNKERIKYLQKVEYRLGCSQLGSLIIYSDNYKEYTTCCSPRYRTYWKSSGDFVQDSIEYTENVTKLIADINEKKPNKCSECSMLHEALWSSVIKCKMLMLPSIHRRDYCNFKCIYCGSWKDNVIKQHMDISAWDVFKAFVSNELVKDVRYNSYEITASPHCDEMLELWKQKRIVGEILTNASIFKNGIAELLRENLITLNCSLDAGTPETFAKIKGVDCFWDVVDNLRKYSASSRDRMRLKYIILPGINDNDADMDGFISIALEIVNENFVFYAHNFNTQITEQEVEATVKFINKCKNAGINPKPNEVTYSVSELDMLKKRLSKSTK